MMLVTVGTAASSGDTDSRNTEKTRRQKPAHERGNKNAPRMAARREVRSDVGFMWEVFFGMS